MLRKFDSYRNANQIKKNFEHPIGKSKAEFDMNYLRPTVKKFCS